MIKTTKTLIFLMSLVICVTISNAEENLNGTKVIDKTFTGINGAKTDVGTSRIKHHYLPLYGGSAILGLGGLHALAVLYAIKVKIIVVAFVIALSIYYYSKIYLKKCQHTEVIRDTNPYESYGPSGYSNSLPPGIGYPGTDRFGSHSIAASEHDHGHDHESIPNIMEFESKSPPPSSPSSTASTATEKEEIIQRVYKQMRQFTNPIFDGIDWTDMGFNLLGLDSDDCRRRFTCELDFRVKQIPFSSYMFDLDGPKFLDKYRESSDDLNKATTFSDCALFYQECNY